MSGRVTRKKRKKIKQGIKIKRRAEVAYNDDALAMLAAGLDAYDWSLLPQPTKQLFRFRARQAMSVFGE